jgi:uncharacterized protein YgbK (DUF1537 family)
MSGAPLIAVADDLTGAAEIAAIGHRYGLRSRVFSFHEASAELLEPGLSVIDSDSRLLPSGEAAGLLTSLGTRISANSPVLVYKKTDSVLRGNVLPECLALARSLGCPRVLLAPANPSLGRRIKAGFYSVNEVPLHETTFARDPHHPARTDKVVDLLQRESESEIHVLNPDQALPASGVILCCASTPEDVVAWAARVDPSCLAAGGGDFFAALLARGHSLRDTYQSPAPLPPPALLISGSTATAAQSLPQRAQALGWPVLPLPDLLAQRASRSSEAAFVSWSKEVARALSSRGIAVCSASHIRSTSRQAPAAIREAFAALALELHQRSAFRHLLVEGGATAAAITGRLSLFPLEVSDEWAQGVISLRPTVSRLPVFTFKPGSYDWPATLWRQLASCYQP